MKAAIKQMVAALEMNEAEWSTLRPRLVGKAAEYAANAQRQTHDALAAYRASNDPLATLTAEEVCAKMYDGGATLPADAVGLVLVAQRHLDAIRSLCGIGGGK